ncbi:hypothetical protein PV433_00830 [Paenibacillus sp. GYB004]|uniref:hypothetical protein n=1 Tax=Paenibacillus sp. GYB004 TaxID=2994393 RepID=UPI002F967259
MSFLLDTFLLQLLSIFFYVVVIYALVRFVKKYKKQEQRITHLEAEIAKIQEIINK